MTLRITLGLLTASMLWSQTSPAVPFPAVTLSPPGTAPLPAVLLTSIPAGFAQQVVSSVSQRCTATPVENQAPASECSVLSGDPRLLIRQGTRLTPAGNSLLNREQTVALSTGQSAVLIAGIDILDESNPLLPAIRTFAGLDNPQVTCDLVSPDQATRTERNIVTFTFNEPLKTLYVVTLHSKTYYGIPPGSPPDLACVSPLIAASSGVPVVEDTTRTLIRVIGPFDDREVQSSLQKSVEVAAER